MADLRQSTSQIIRFGPFLDLTDGVTPETALTITQANMQLSKDGATFAQKSAAGNAVHDVDGWYSTTFSITDSDTLAILEFQVNVAGALPVFKSFNVIHSNTYDAKYTNGLNNVTATDIVSAGAITTLSGAIVNVDLVDAVTTLTNKTGFSLAAAGLDAITQSATGMIEIAKAVWDRVISKANHNISQSAGKKLRQGAAFILGDGIAQAGTASSITLEATESGLDNFLRNQRILIVDGTGAGQERVVVDYNGTTKVASVKPDWTTIPDATSDYERTPATVHTVTQEEGYTNGQIFLDTNASNTNTIVEVDGIARNPVSTLTAVNTLLTLTGLKAIHFIPGSIVTLNQTFIDFEFFGRNAEIDFGNQIISGTIVVGHDIKGIINSTSVISNFEKCTVLAAGLTSPPVQMRTCSFAGTFTANASGDYIFEDCKSATPDGVTIAINVAGDGITARNIVAQNFSGSIEIQNLSAIDSLVFTGNGKLVINANNLTGAIITLAGDIKLINNAIGIIIQQADIGAIKAKTDKLTFTSGNDLDTNIQKINDTVVVGDGKAGNEWGS